MIMPSRSLIKKMAASDEFILTAEENIQVNHIDQRDLYAASSKHEKRLLRCVKDLSNFVSMRVGEADKDVFWSNFRAWTGENKEAATLHAGAYVASYLDAKSGNVSVGHSLRLHLLIWKDWSIEVSPTVREQINRLDREQWRPAKIQRLNALSNRKSTQFEVIDKNWERMVLYMASTTPNDFAAHLRSIDKPGNIPASIFSEIIVLSNKSNEELGRVLLRFLT